MGGMGRIFGKPRRELFLVSRGRPSRLAGGIAGAISNDAGVPGIIFGQLENDLHEVGPDVRDPGLPLRAEKEWAGVGGRVDADAEPGDAAGA